MARRKLQPVTELEQEILKHLWEHPESTIRRLTDAVYQRGSDSEYATVQKILERLELKGYVKRDRSTQAHRFRAVIEKSEFLRGNLQSLADKLCDGSLTPLVSCLVNDKQFSATDLQSLRDLVDRLEEQKSKARRRGK